MTVLDDLPSVYDPQSVEPAIRAMWEAGNYFHAEPDANGNPEYVIVIPPPNVTGALHGGHALNNSLQDVLIRWHRMRGFNTLWMPGTDHAGIATQAVVERTIFEKEGKSRHDLGREELVRRIWAWKEQYGNHILKQLNWMGCSCDWDRTRFTLDDVCARAVRHTFFKLFKDGLIVRGKRLVNWDTQLQTAVADDEVYHETVNGHFYHFKYRVIERQPGEPEFVHIATTRPETMLGDTAVAVHPDPVKALDKVEAELQEQLAGANSKTGEMIAQAIEALNERRETMLPTLLKLRDMAADGRHVLLPLVERPIPLVADEWAKPELGSGCVKITPAHDPNDYEVGQRHDLPMINVMTPDGLIADLSSHSQAPKFTRTLEGLKFATKGRKAVVAALEERDLVEKIEDRQIELGHSDRSKTPVEPFLSDQWFVKMGDLPAEEAARIEGLRGRPGLAQLAMDMVAEEALPTFDQRRESGKVHFFPDRYRKTYLDWLKEKRDWCISRQLWWGHRIPVWTFKFSPHVQGGQNSAQIRDEQRKLLSILSEALDDLFEATSVNKSFSIKAKEGGAFSAFVCPLNEEQDRALEAVKPYVESKQARNTKPFEKDPPLIKMSSTDRRYDSVSRLKRILETMERDEDVLDTWFSSALWPHSTLGWPEENAALARYYPGSTLSTAREIITLWVARMVLTGMYNLGRVPFHDVYIHAVIQDGEGRPFKKSLGNGFDPIDIIEVYGADALRYTMAGMSTETQDIRMPMKRVKLDDGRELQSSEKFELGRNFCNKIWNAARFAFMNLEGATCETRDVASLPVEDRWILSRVSRAARDVQDALEHYQFSRAASIVRDFFWDSLCDWYLELVKSRIKEDRQAAEAKQVLAFALDQSLRLLHPIMPFITEKLWEILNEIAPQRGLPGVAELDTDKALIVSSFPPLEGWSGLDDPAVDAIFDDLQTATRAVRDIRQKQNVPPKQKVDVTVKAPASSVDGLRQQAHVIRELANVGELTVDADATAPRNAATLVIGEMQIYVADVIDPEAERKRLEKELANLDKQMGGIRGKLSNAKFVENAPSEVVERERERLGELEAKRATVEATMRELG